MCKTAFRKSRQVEHARRGKQARAVLRAGVVAALNVIGGAGFKERRSPGPDRCRLRNPGRSR
jgi:hypothetical protein